MLRQLFLFLGTSLVLSSQVSCVNWRRQTREDIFTVVLHTQETQPHHVRNFVYVSIQPSESTMLLEDFSVTASLTPRNNTGSVWGSSGKKSGGGFEYEQPLDNCNLKQLFLTAPCTFETGEAASFKIAVEPSEDIAQGQIYELAVEVTYHGQDNRTHTARRIVSLKAPRKSSSPSKKGKHHTSRKTH